MSDNYDDEKGGGFGTNGFQMMGIMNALKTGDVRVDMIIAMCVPFVLKMIFGWLGKVEDLMDLEEWINWWNGRVVCEREHERFISYSTIRNSWGSTSSVDSDSENSFLLKAVKLYLNQVVKLKLRSAHLDLTEGEFDSANDDDDDHYDSRRTLVGILGLYKIIKTVPSNEWHDLGSYGSPPGSVKMRIMHEEKDKDENNPSKSQIDNTTLHFKSPEDGAIDHFIDSAYKWYLGELQKLEDHSRYLYEMKAPESRIGRDDDDSDDGGSGGTSYKRYKLSSEKTFDSLFFREKESLLGLIDHFSEKSGKYSIKGYPHKLGILLHGPPGKYLVERSHHRVTFCFQFIFRTLL
jgi:chaperone BCS1